MLRRLRALALLRDPEFRRMVDPLGGTTAP